MVFGFGFSLGDILNQWAEMGVFAYGLPFLIIFAMVYAILSNSDMLGNNKGVNATLALASALLALQWDYVPEFFSIIFPYTGVAIGILLVAMILMGFFANEKWEKYIWGGLGAISFLIILWISFLKYSYGGIGFFSISLYLPGIIAIGIFLGIIAWIIKGDS